MKTKQFARKSIAAALTTAALAFAVAPVGAADQSDDWLEQQPPNPVRYAPRMPVVGEPIRVEPLVWCHARGGVVTDGECVKREVRK